MRMSAGFCQIRQMSAPVPISAPCDPELHLRPHSLITVSRLDIHTLPFILHTAWLQGSCLSMCQRFSSITRPWCSTVTRFNGEVFLTRPSSSRECRQVGAGFVVELSKHVPWSNGWCIGPMAGTFEMMTHSSIVLIIRLFSLHHLTGTLRATRPMLI